MMDLHDFLKSERDTLVGRAVGKVRERWPEQADEILAYHLRRFIEDVVAAIEQPAGPAPSPTSLDIVKPVAAELGKETRRRGASIQALVASFGAVSDQLGELAGSRGLSFSAAEYRVFNQSVDSAIATALETYFRDEQSRGLDPKTKQIGQLAHELRNSLSTARMALAILKEGRLGAESRTGDIINRSHARMQALIEKVLTASRLEAGVEAQREPTSITELLRNVVGDAVLERDITIALECEREVKVEGDPLLLTSAVSNLVQNAIKYSHENGKVIVRARVANGEAIIEVEDECGGLPAHQREALFAPFVRGRKDKEGVGLGLSIVNEAVRLHGGKLEVRDLPGKGCIFCIRLPAA
ncbi:HAMP domain-containing histidine kinase [Pendulispora brunnea]|uniref:histidine kinase n=1 Tax=Pendulispora brunnea TaxID=2905690 RepID=A0ABZ2KBU1_9BACT